MAWYLVMYWTTLLLTFTCHPVTYKTISLSVVSYGCETWSLTLREDHKLSLIENGVLRRIFGPKKEEEKVA
jgi:hypothetical protein